MRGGGLGCGGAGSVKVIFCRVYIFVADFEALILIQNTRHKANSRSLVNSLRRCPYVLIYWDTKTH